jgi:hypothetical protein
MKAKILDYKIYLFGNGKADYLWASMEDGQKIIMAMASNNPPKFIRLGESLINASSISSIVKDEERMDVMTEVRELTASEEATAIKFLEVMESNKLLN